MSDKHFFSWLVKLMSMSNNRVKRYNWLINQNFLVPYISLKGIFGSSITKISLFNAEFKDIFG